jgi:hypothetical protein
MVQRSVADKSAGAASWASLGSGPGGSGVDGGTSLWFERDAHPAWFARRGCVRMGGRSPGGAARGRGGLLVDTRGLRDNPGSRRVVGLDCEGGFHVGDLPERETPRAAFERSIEDGSSVAGDETVREVAVRRVAGGALREIASQER